MRVFLEAPLRTEAQVEPKLICEPRFLRMPDGKHRMTWLPKVVWEAHDYCVARGVGESEFVAWGLRHSEESGWPFDLAYTAVIYHMAHLRQKRQPQL